MYRLGAIMLFLALVSGGIVGMVTRDWQLAAYTIVGVVVFGYFLLLGVLHKRRGRVREKDTVILSRVLRDAQAKTKEIEASRQEFLLTISRDIAEPLSELEKSTSLLLSGAYGRLPPAAEEAVRQIEEAARAASEAMEKYRHAPPPEPAPSVEESRVHSIKKLKVS